MSELKFSSPPIPLALGRFKQLAQRSNEVWQGSIRKLPAWVDNPEGPDLPPYRPVAAFWVSLRTGMIHIAMAEVDHATPAELGVRSFLEFGLKSGKQLDGRPSRVEVNDQILMESLTGPLASLGTPVVLVDHLPQLDAAFREIEAQATGGERLPGALEAGGVTVDRLRAYADAAAQFFRAKPWAHLANEDLIVVESPKAPRGLAQISVMGNGGQEFGLSFFDSRKAFDRMIAAESPRAIKEVHGLTFSPIDELPFGDVDAFEVHALPVAGPTAYPMASRMRADGTMTRPGGSEVTFIEALLRALAVTSEGELDSGRWQHEVATFDGRVTVTLTLPLLLEAERGDRSRAPRPDVMPPLAERAGVQIARLLKGREFSSLEEANAAIAQAQREGLLDVTPAALDKQARTPLEHAQDLAYEAMEAMGRLRIKLARQAIATSPDCADAWAILADAATDPDITLAHYREAVDAGARAIGADFNELAGEFWGHLQTRPYMRARLGLARALLDLGQIEETVVHYRELLRLNPGDNQGVRYLLIPLLLEEGKDEEAGALLDQFDNDRQAIWPYGRALWLFRRDGDTAKARAALATAVRANPLVAEFLLDPESMPLDRAPYITLGGEDEAAMAAEELLPAFTDTPGAEAWLLRHAPALPRGGRRRASSGPRPRRR